MKPERDAQTDLNGRSKTPLTTGLRFNTLAVAILPREVVSATAIARADLLAVTYV
jgi:hypothetical protein